MDKATQMRIQLLLSLIAPRLASVKRIKLMEKISTISGFDLVFIMGLIIRYKYSGNLNIVNEENELSSLTFIYGDIVKVDYPDQEHLLGNVLADSEFIAKHEVAEIVEKATGQRLGDYLIKNNHLTQPQLRDILFKQSKLRLTKYLNNKNIRIHFVFDGQSCETTLISRVNYSEILYKWIFEIFKTEWLTPYAEYYGANYIQPNIDQEAFRYLKDFPEAYLIAQVLSVKNRNKITYHELFFATNISKPLFIRALHYMVLSGFVVIRKNRDLLSTLAKSVNADNYKLDEDLQLTKLLMLNKKYFEAFGVLNKYSTLSSSHEKVNFYIIWVKLIGAFYKNHLLDTLKIEKNINEIDMYQIDPAEHYYVRALLAASQKKYQESDELFNKAVNYDKMYLKFPINNQQSFVKIIKNFFNSLKITG